MDLPQCYIQYFELCYYICYTDLSLCYQPVYSSHYDLIGTTINSWSAAQTASGPLAAFRAVVFYPSGVGEGESYPATFQGCSLPLEGRQSLAPATSRGVVYYPLGDGKGESYPATFQGCSLPLEGRQSLAPRSKRLREGGGSTGF